MSKKTKSLKKRVVELQSMLDIVCNEPNTPKAIEIVMVYKMLRKTEEQVMFGDYNNICKPEQEEPGWHAKVGF